MSDGNQNDKARAQKAYDLECRRLGEAVVNGDDTHKLLNSVGELRLRLAKFTR